MKPYSIILDFFRVAHWVADGMPYEKSLYLPLAWLPHGSLFYFYTRAYLPLVISLRKMTEILFKHIG